MLQVRRAGETDAGWISKEGWKPEARHSPHEDFYEEAELRELSRSPNHLLLVAEEDSGPAGFLLAELSKDSAWIDCHSGGKEALSALAREAFKEFGSRGISWARTLVRSEDSAAREAFSGQGFREGFAYARLELSLPSLASMIARVLPKPSPPAGVELRRASPADARSLFSLAQAERELHMSPHWQYSEEEFRESLSSPAAVAFAAFEAGSCIGFVTGSNEGKAAEFDDIMVSREARRRGIATSLALAFLHELARGGVRLVYGYVRSDNEALIRTYTARGAKRFGEFKLFEARLPEQ